MQNFEAEHTRWRLMLCVRKRCLANSAFVLCAHGDETHFLLDCPSLADEWKQALLTLQQEIINVKGGKKLWKWYEDLPTKYEKALGKLPPKTINGPLYTWYITAAKGLNKMYQQKLKLSNMKTWRH
jgi:hypothetical protein